MVENIDQEMEYEIEERLTIAEKFAKGMFNGWIFVVSDTNKDIGEFDTFEEADSFAQNLCQSRINERLKVMDLARYYKQSVVNNAQMAGERDEIRLYPWYNYKGDEKFISVYPKKA